MNAIKILVLWVVLLLQFSELSARKTEIPYQHFNFPPFKEENIDDSKYFVIAYMPFEMTGVISFFYTPFDICIKAQISVEAHLKPHSFKIQCGISDAVNHYFQEYVMKVTDKGVVHEPKLLETPVNEKFFQLKDERLPIVSFYRPFNNSEYVLIWGCLFLPDEYNDQGAWILFKNPRGDPNINFTEHFTKVSNKIKVVNPKFASFEKYFLLNRITKDCESSCLDYLPSKVHKLLLENSYSDRHKTFDIFYIDPKAYKFLAVIIICSLIILVLSKIRRFFKCKSKISNST